MPPIPLHPPSASRTPPSSLHSPLPGLLQTPLGLAILELQGTINFPTPGAADQSSGLGKLVFPDYDEARDGDQEGRWMKRVWLHVGYQRMAGELKKLEKPWAVVGRRRANASQAGGPAGSSAPLAEQVEELEVREIVRWKILVNSRPEPVTLSGT